MFYEKLLGLLGGDAQSPESVAAKRHLNNQTLAWDSWKNTSSNTVCVCVWEGEWVSVWVSDLLLQAPFDQCSWWHTPSYCDGGVIEELELLGGQLPGLSDHQLPQPAAAFSQR